MPRIKTESEVATMHFLRKYTNFPVPTVFHYDASPYNRLGGEYILMSKVIKLPTPSVVLGILTQRLVLHRQLEFPSPKFTTPCRTITS